jgi:hydrogenase maturation factor
MRVLKLDPARAVALCEEEGGGRRVTVETALVDPLAPGDEVLVHAGVALIRLEPAA